MAPPFNERPTGTVPKNKPRSSQQSSAARNRQTSASILDFEPVLDNRSQRWRSQEQVSDSRYDNRMSAAQENGDGTWTPNDNEPEVNGHSSNAPSRKSSVNSRQHNNWNGANQSTENAPDRKQVALKLRQIQDYVLETTTLMNALKAQDTPRSREQYEKLSVMVADLQDSETKLSTLLTNMDKNQEKMRQLLAEEEQIERTTDVREEELRRKAEDSRRKLEAMTKHQQELLAAQERTRRELQTAQEERDRLISRMKQIETGGQNDGSLQGMGQRIKNIQQLYNERSQASALLEEEERNGDEMDEDKDELSEDETDLQSVKEKMDELNAMKAQLSQLQNVMNMLNTQQPEPNNEPTCERSSGQNSARLDGSPATMERRAEEVRAKELKLENARTKLNQLNELMRIVQQVQNSGSSEGIPPHLMQMIHSLAEDDDDDSRPASPTPERSPVPQPTDEAAVIQLQSMTRELQEHTQAMRAEQERLIETRRALQSRLNDINRQKETIQELETTPREPVSLGDLRELSRALTSSRPASERASPFVCRLGDGCVTPTGSIKSVNKMQTRARSEDPRNVQREISQPPAANFLSNLLQTQAQLDEASSICDRLLNNGDSLGGATPAVVPPPISQEWAIQLYNQHHLLSKTVTQCAQMLCVQQRQIQELRQALLLKQSITHNQQLQDLLNTLQNTAAASPAPSQNDLQTELLLNLVQQQQQQAAAAPASTNSQNDLALNFLQPVQQDHSCTLNNQVAPGNRANNYWDNFRSYSRQNMLSNTLKSNEDSSRRSQEQPTRKRFWIMESGASVNNQLHVPNAAQSSTQSNDLGGDAQRQNHSQIIRSRSVDPQNLRTSLKNEASGGADDSRSSDGQTNNTKRNEKGRSRNEARENLNNRSDINSILRDNVYLEVTNFIRANETRPHFLIQLFRDLQQINTDALRQRTLHSIHENVNTVDETQRRSNLRRCNIEERIDESLNVFENRTNNLDTSNRIDEIFSQLRENQNTIRQNMGVCELNLPRRNVELSNHSRNEQPPILNNQTRSSQGQPTGMEQYLTMNPKNMYVDRYEKIVGEMRRRNMLDSTQLDLDLSQPSSSSAAMDNATTSTVVLEKLNDDEEVITLEQWGQNLLNDSYNDSCLRNVVHKTEAKAKLVLLTTDNGDLAEADQSRTEADSFTQPSEHSRSFDGATASDTQTLRYIDLEMSANAPESENYFPCNKDNLIRAGADGDCEAEEDNEIVARLEHLSNTINSLEEEVETDILSGRNTSPEAELGWEMENGLDQVPSRLQRGQDSPNNNNI